MHKYESLIGDIRKEINQILELNIDLEEEKIKEVITEKVFEKSKEVYLSTNDKRQIVENIYNAIKKLDSLQPLIDDPEISEIMINGAEKVFVEKNGDIRKVDLKFKDSEKLEQIIQKIVSKVNRVVNETNPIVDARLEDGSRVNIVMNPIALNGPIVTIRKFVNREITSETLIKYKTINKEAADFLERLVKAKYNIFISGGTSSGKTTFLNMLSNFILSGERIITIEDSAELCINGIDNLVRLETRNKNTEGKGEITIKDLIRTSLRMRPDRIIVGEVRGAEALDMLQAMNTGHDGSLSTGHANSTKDALSRIETMVLSGVDMPLTAVRQQIASGIDIIIHLARVQDKSRKVLEISEIVGCVNNEIKLNILYQFKVNDNGYGRLEKVGEIRNDFKLKMNG